MSENNKHTAEHLLALDTMNLEEAGLNFAEAQVHATLYHAEQQRLANLIALYNSDILDDNVRVEVAKVITRALITWEVE